MPMEEVGSFVTQLPPSRAGVRGEVDWDAYAMRARRQPGRPLLVARGVRESLIKSVRQRDRSPFIDASGRILVNARNGARDEAGKYVADVYFVWRPREED